MSREAWAAWIQAFFSVAAIVATWSLTSKQMRETIRHEKQMLAGQLSGPIYSIVALCRQSRQLIDEMHTRTFDHNWSGFHEQAKELESNISVLEKLPMDDHPQRLLVAELKSFVSALSHYQHAIKTCSVRRGAKDERYGEALAIAAAEHRKAISALATIEIGAASAIQMLGKSAGL